MFAGRVKIVSHSSCSTSAILKYFCPLYLLSGEHNSQAYSIQNSTFLASLCSLGDCFESRLSKIPKTGFVATRPILSNTQENLFSGFPAKKDSNQSADLYR